MAAVILSVVKSILPKLKTESTPKSFPWLAVRSCNFKGSFDHQHTNTNTSIQHHTSHNSNFDLVERKQQTSNQWTWRKFPMIRRTLYKKKKNTHKHNQPYNNNKTDSPQIWRNARYWILTLYKHTHPYRTLTQTHTRSFDSILMMMLYTEKVI